MKQISFTTIIVSNVSYFLLLQLTFGFLHVTNDCRPEGFSSWRLRRRPALHAPSTASRATAPGALRRRSYLLRCGSCRTSRLKFSAAGRPGPACRSSPLSPFRHNSRAAPPFSVLLAGPFRAPPGRAAPPFSSLQARPLLPIQQATCHVVAHWQGERGRNVPAGKELFLLCSICFAAPSATAPIAAGDSACGPRRAALYARQLSAARVAPARPARSCPAHGLPHVSPPAHPASTCPTPGSHPRLALPATSL